jgi:DNA-binding transcriptional MocR family regulator
MCIQIMEQIKQKIAVGEWTHGQTTPFIRQLDEDLEVSVITVKRAYLELEREGIIVPHHGRGQSPILVRLNGGKWALVVGQKSGTVHAVDPAVDPGDKSAKDNILWQTRAGVGNALSGSQWGSAIGRTEDLPRDLRHRNRRRPGCNPPSGLSPDTRPEEGGQTARARPEDRQDRMEH